MNSHSLFTRIDLENVWGHVNLYAVGAGQAVAQLDVTYGVDYEPFKVAIASISVYRVTILRGNSLPLTYI